jgi:hypothetical protein
MMVKIIGFRQFLIFVKKNLIYCLPLLIFLVYLYAIYYLKINKFLDIKDFINNLTIFVGWIVALLIGLIHLERTGRDNRLAKKEEIRKSLEINAFREINKAITEFSSILSGVATPYVSLPGKLELHLRKPLLFGFNIIEIDMELRKKDIEIYTGIIKFILAIESNEIAVIEFDHYRKYIQLRVEDLHDIIKSFSDYFSKLKVPDLETNENFIEFKRKSLEVYEKIGDIESFLFDYRIELMNSVLKEIFDKQVPERRPRDSKYKTLKQLAIKEDVEKEAESREIRAMSQG